MGIPQSLDLGSNTELTTIRCSHNQLEYLNIANGNNLQLNMMWSHENPDLFCIIIDEDFDLANIPEDWYKPVQAEYNGNCCSATSAEFNEFICEGETFLTPGGNIIMNSGIYMENITNEGGCDSLITIYLDVIPVDSEVTQEANTLTANAIDATYQWLDCNNENAVIDGATEQIFNPEENGSYAVLVSQNGCLEVSNCFDITTVDLDNVLPNNIKIYPNPTDAWIQVDLGESYENVLLSVYNSTSQLIQQMRFDQVQMTQLELEYNGVYFLEIQTGNTILSKMKIIKL